MVLLKAGAVAPELSRRVLGPTVFSTTWSYVDHIVVRPDVSTPLLQHGCGEGHVSEGAPPHRTALKHAEVV